VLKHKEDAALNGNYCLLVLCYAVVGRSTNCK